MLSSRFSNRIVVLIAFFCIVASSFHTTFGADGDPNTIKIVSSLPRTGSAQGQTNSIVNGIKMALDDVDYKVGNFKIVYQDKDDATAQAQKWDAGQETTNAKEAVADPDVMVYIGTFNSGAAKVSMPILNQAHMLMISPANTAIGLTKPSGIRGEPENYRPSGKINFVRVCPADDLQGPLAAEWAKSLGVKKVYVLDDNEMYGAGLSALFSKKCREIGIQVLGQEHIDAQATDFKATMTKIKRFNPDLIYFGGTSQSKGGQVAKDIKQNGLTCKLMVPDGCMEEAFIEAAGAANVNDSCYVTFPGLPAKELTGSGKKFYETYKKKYSIEPEPYAVYGYEACLAALHAIRTAGKKDRDAILQAGTTIKDFEGALGKWSFDKNGDTTLKMISGNVIRNGKFEFSKVLEVKGKK